MRNGKSAGSVRGWGRERIAARLYRYRLRRRSLDPRGCRMPARTLHDVPRDAFNYVWDHSIPPVLEVDDGDEVQLHLRDASDEQIARDSDASAIANLDFEHVNPVSGPVFVRGARPGDV